jgi:hypothetical protein
MTIKAPPKMKYKIARPSMKAKLQNTYHLVTKPPRALLQNLAEQSTQSGPKRAPTVIRAILVPPVAKAASRFSTSYRSIPNLRRAYMTSVLAKSVV